MFELLFGKNWSKKHMSAKEGISVDGPLEKDPRYRDGQR